METERSTSQPDAERDSLPEMLVRDFGSKSQLARRGVCALYDAIVSADEPVAAASLEQWKTLFGLASGCDLARPSARIGKLARRYGISTDGLQPDAMLFALHTYYSLPVKILLRGEAFGEHGAYELLRDDPFCWPTLARSTSVQRLIRQLADRAEPHQAAMLSQRHLRWSDPLGRLYQELFPRSLRHELGEYYTPDWLAEHVLDLAGYTGDPHRRLLDPACGSGTFLIAAIRRVRAWYHTQRDRTSMTEAELGRMILTNIVGFDLNPLAVMTARANCLMAVADLLPRRRRMRPSVELCDSILDGPREAQHTAIPFDYVVGNPPWIAWDNLPDDYRRASKPLWQRYGLFTLTGNEARHGGGKKDLSMLMLYTAADRYLADGGRLAMVVTQTVFQTKGAGDGFRRFRLGPDGQGLKVLRVDDMGALKPFADANNFTATILLEKGRPTQYPVPYVKWSPGDTAADGRRLPKQRTYRAEPIDPSRPGSPWFLRPEGFTRDLAELTGPSDYQAYLGANSGGANGVYWVTLLGPADGGVRIQNIAKKNKRSIDTVQRVIEPDLLYPLIRWGDVRRFSAIPSAHLLLAQDVATRTGIDENLMRQRYPRTYEYLRHFEQLLRDRAAYRRYQDNRPFYSMYNVGTYTPAPIKVVWRRMDRQINAAVVTETDDPLLGRRPAIPQETCVLIECPCEEEAHYLCAVLNSSIVNFLVGSHSVVGGKGFGTPGMLDFVRLRRFDSDDPRHGQLAAYSRRAHITAAAAGDDTVAGDDTTELQRQIDATTAQLWDLSQSDIEAIRSDRS